MSSTQPTYSLTHFLRNHRAHLERIKETRTPEVLTVNGEAELVVIDRESYQEIQDRLQRVETIEAIREGFAAAERGEMKPVRQVFAEMKAKYGIRG